MASFKFYCFSEDQAEKAHNLATDALKVMLTNSAPALTNTTKTDITEISAGNGYSAGGVAITVTSSSQTLGDYKLVLQDATLTASGGSIGPFRYGVLYNSTNDKLIGYTDKGSSITLADGEEVVIDFDAAAGAITI